MQLSMEAKTWVMTGMNENKPYKRNQREKASMGLGPRRSRALYVFHITGRVAVCPAGRRIAIRTFSTVRLSELACFAHPAPAGLHSSGCATSPGLKPRHQTCRVNHRIMRNEGTPRNGRTNARPDDVEPVAMPCIRTRSGRPGIERTSWRGRAT